MINTLKLKRLIRFKKILYKTVITHAQVYWVPEQVYLGLSWNWVETIIFYYEKKTPL